MAVKNFERLILNSVFVRCVLSLPILHTSGNFDQVEVDMFVDESLKMSRFKHAHVMGLIGVCLDAGSAPYIIMPYMANGSLLKYLKRERNGIVILDENDEDEVITVGNRQTLEYFCYFFR